MPAAVRLAILLAVPSGGLGWLLAVQEDGQASRSGVVFTEVTRKAGIDFQHANAATGEKYLIETMGPGCAFLDYDADGYLDIFFVNGAALPGYAPERPLRNALYRNNGDGTFANVTRQAGLEGGGYGMGVAVGDYDNNGFPDLYVTNYRSSLLYRNQGDGSFLEVAEVAHVNNKKWGASALFFDYDKDGLLDLYVANYLDYSLDNNIYCGTKPGFRSYCHPDEFEGVADVLYHNNGDGTFMDVSRAAAIDDPKGKGLGVIAADLNDDGYQDLYVANDAVPNFLFFNNRDGVFWEVGPLAGAAYSGYGRAQSGMGTHAGDFNGDGKLDLLVTNLSNEGHTLYRNEGGELFTDVTFPTGVGPASLLLTGWGTAFFDYDNDGDQDIFVAHGHVMDTIELLNATVTYLQPLLLLENRGGHFVDVTAESGEDLVRPRAARGASFGDYDNDGDVDILVANCNQRPSLLRNDGGNRNHWLALRPVGRQSNRDGIGVKVSLWAGGKVQRKELVAGGSYLSSHDSRLHFGLGAARVADRIEVTWPSGRTQLLTDVRGDRTLVVREP